MINFRHEADELIDEWNLCKNARPKNNAADIQILKDTCKQWVNYLHTQKQWGSEVELAEACHQLKPRLKQLQEQVIIEILKHGTI
jgi:hypothetical protein